MNKKTLRTPAVRSLIGLTLVELLITISLMGMIILAITAIDVGSRRFLNTANYEAQVQSEVSPVLERMVKDITLAYGQSDNPGINITGSNQITIRRLDSGSPPSYANFDDDPRVRYTYNSSNLYISRETSSSCAGGVCSWNPAEVIARNIESGTFSQGTDGVVGINMTARRNAQATPPPDTFENPRVTLETSVLPRSTSLN